MRLAKPVSFVLAVAVSMLAATAALAGVPSPFNSTIPACVAICPFGDMPIDVTVRDLASNPVNGSFVVLDFTNCPAVVFCPPLASDGYTISGRTVSGITNSSGFVRINLHAGGLCEGSLVTIYADGVQLGTRNVSSPDQDGSLFVTGADQTLQAGGAATPGKDLDCDGSRTAADAGIVAAHLGHTCTSIVGSRGRSWGTLKMLYR